MNVGIGMWEYSSFLIIGHQFGSLISASTLGRHNLLIDMTHAYLYALVA